ncbi:hypothetical protein J7J55_05055 [Candidatus Bipolaricaulota bacterium]|nr:hypothetical protein [Candidatus Bipolaricaulota bacterium]
MAQVLIRDLDPEVIEALKRRAKEHNRSLQGELKAILEQVVRNSHPRNIDAFLARVREIRKQTAGIPQTDAAQLVREDRNR